MSLCRFCGEECIDEFCLYCKMDPTTQALINLFTDNLKNVAIHMWATDTAGVTTTLTTEWYAGNAVYFKYQMWNEDYRMFLN